MGRALGAARPARARERHRPRPALPARCRRGRSTGRASTPRCRARGRAELRTLPARRRDRRRARTRRRAAEVALRARALAGEGRRRGARRLARLDAPLRLAGCGGCSSRSATRSPGWAVRPRRRPPRRLARSPPRSLAARGRRAGRRRSRRTPTSARSPAPRRAGARRAARALRRRARALQERRGARGGVAAGRGPPCPSAAAPRRQRTRARGRRGARARPGSVRWDGGCRRRVAAALDAAALLVCRRPPRGCRGWRSRRSCAAAPCRRARRRHPRHRRGRRQRPARRAGDAARSRRRSSACSPSPALAQRARRRRARRRPRWVSTPEEYAARVRELVDDAAAMRAHLRHAAGRPRPPDARRRRGHGARPRRARRRGRRARRLGGRDAAGERALSVLRRADAGAARRSLRGGARARAPARPPGRVPRAHVARVRAPAPRRSAPLRVPVLLWFTQQRAGSTFTAPSRVVDAILSVDERSVPVSSPKVRAIGHGIDTGLFTCAQRPEHEGLRVLSLGRYSEVKGHDVAIRALPALRGAQLTVHGEEATPSDAHVRARLDALVRELGLEGRVHLLDAVPRDEVPALLAEADVLVNATHGASADKVVFEALASCTPVVAASPVFDGAPAVLAPVRRRRPCRARLGAQGRGRPSRGRAPPAARPRRGRALGRALGGRGRRSR